MRQNALDRIDAMRVSAVSIRELAVASLLLSLVGWVVKAIAS